VNKSNQYERNGEQDVGSTRVRIIKAILDTAILDTAILDTAILDTAILDTSRAAQLKYIDTHTQGLN
jgi:hypothetical protein